MTLSAINPLPGLLMCLGLIASVSVTANDTPVSVTTLPADTLLVAVDYDIAASVMARNVSVLSAEITATVTQVSHDVGSVVKKDTRLIDLDATGQKLILRRAKAERNRLGSELQLARARLQRGEQLAEKQYVSRDEYSDLGTRVAILNAQIVAADVGIAEAQDQLDDTQIKAPFDAVVTSRQAQVGALVTVGEPLMTLTQIDQPEISAGVSTEQLSSLQSATAIRFIEPNGATRVRLLRASPVLDPINRLHVVRLGNFDDPLTVGQAGRVSWQSDVTYLPTSYVQRRGAALGVFVVDRDDNTRARFVVIDNAEEGRPTRVDLPLGTLVIDSGREKLSDAALITVQIE